MSSEQTYIGSNSAESFSCWRFGQIVLVLLEAVFAPPCFEIDDTPTTQNPGMKTGSGWRQICEQEPPLVVER
jgi:hypothetical protein